MERKSNTLKTKESHKVRSNSTSKTNENKLMVQLHHFSNLSKSTTTTIADTLNFTGESKAILENDYFKLINFKQQHKNTEFVAKPFVINKNTDAETDFCDKIRGAASFNNKKYIYNKKEFKDLVSTKFKAKDKIPKSSFAIACRDINSMISIKDYHSVFCKKIFETRLFINGILIYNSLKQHYSGVSVARNCFKKKFNNILDKATKEIFPEMESIGTTNNNKENRLLQNVIDYYENQENNINLFNEHMVQIPDINDDAADDVELFLNDSKGDELILECDEVIEERSVTPTNEYFSPESYETPPSQRLMPMDLSGTTASKYQTVFYERDAKSGKASLFEVPDSFDVTNASNINRNVLKRIDLSHGEIFPSCSNSKGRVETARFVASGKLQMNELELLCVPGTSPTSNKPKKCPKKRLFHNYSDDGDDSFEFHPLEYRNSDEGVFVRPTYSPKEFTEIKKKYHSLFSPRDFVPKQKYLQTLKVDELDFYVQRNSTETLKNITKIKTPEHRYYPFIQFDRK